MADITGLVHSFQSMGAVDGPGIRFVVFMQGCNLRCAYCHNPDTWDMTGGTPYTATEVAARVSRYLPYLTGGITVTGGEPLLQAEFVRELFIKAGELGLHRALDTSGVGHIGQAERLLEHTDLVLCDVKFTTADRYMHYAKAELGRVLEFLSLCKRLAKPVWIRHVVVPSLSSEESILRLKELILPYMDIIEKVELLPFRKLCLAKYDNMGIEFPLRDIPEASEGMLEEFRKILDA